MKISAYAALCLFMATLAFGQGCPQGQVFLKNDNLPANPSGATAVSVVPGLCEGEAIGCVFDVSAIGAVVQVDLAAVGFFNAAGANGIQAAANLQIYDGITWSGGIPTLGPQVFDFATSAGASIGVTSHAINTQDISGFNVTVSSGKLVVAWPMDFNPNGTCPTGYQTNFGTDNPAFTFTCTTPPQKNLIMIQGQGWRDAATANVGGIPLCPIFYNGNWVIRACVHDVTPVNPLSIAFLPSSSTFAGGLTLVRFVGQPADGGKIYIPLVSCTLGTTPIPSTTLALPILIDVCTSYQLNDPSSASVFALAPPGQQFGFLLSGGPQIGTASGTVTIPVNVVAPPAGIPLYFAWVLVNPAGGVIEGVSPAAALTIF
jgi:hypothetical protein